MSRGTVATSENENLLPSKNKVIGLINQALRDEKQLGSEGYDKFKEDLDGYISALETAYKNEHGEERYKDSLIPFLNVLLPVIFDFNDPQLLKKFLDLGASIYGEVEPPHNGAFGEDLNNEQIYSLVMQTPIIFLPKYMVMHRDILHGDLAPSSKQWLEGDLAPGCRGLLLAALLDFKDPKNIFGFTFGGEVSRSKTALN